MLPFKICRHVSKRVFTVDICCLDFASYLFFKHNHQVVVGGLAVGTWYSLKLWTATESGRQQAIIYAATTTHSGGKARSYHTFRITMVVYLPRALHCMLMSARNKLLLGNGCGRQTASWDCVHHTVYLQQNNFDKPSIVFNS